MTRRYAGYVDTGLIWLGEVPSSWKLARLGSCFSERKEKVSDKDFPALSVTMNGIVPQLDTAAKTDDGDNRKLVLQGDFVIKSRSDRKGSSGLSELDGSVSLISIVIVPEASIQGRFANWLLKSRSFQEEFYRWGSGIVADLWSTRYADMRSITLAVPPLPEQTAIAAFLDRETAKIDGLIEQQRRLIDLLREKRQAVISHAVTRGLNPHAPLKPSGIDWLGDVPEGWEVKRLRHVARLRTIKAETANNPIGLENIEGWTGRFIVTDTEFQGDGVAFSAGDILFGKLRPYLAKVAVAESDGEAVGDFHVLAPVEGIHSRFLQRHLLAPAVISVIDGSTYGSKMPRVGWDFMADLPLAIPPLSEQIAIADWLKDATAKLDTLTTTAENAIALLQERRAALISAAVTGKIDVRGLVKQTEAA